MPDQQPAEYDVSDVLPFEDFTTIPAGTNVLIAGPAYVGKKELGHELLARAVVNDEDAVAISTDGNAAAVSNAVQRVAEAPVDDSLFVIDCSRGATSSDNVPAGHVTNLSSPADMTGIGIELAKHDRQRSGTRSGTRVLFDSITTLLQYVDRRRAFQFVDVLTGRFTVDGYLSLFVIDDAAIDDQTVSMFAHEFDAQIKLRESDGGREIALRGFPGVSTEWRSYELPSQNSSP